MAFQDYVKQKYGSQNKTGTGSTGSSGNAQNFSSYVSNKYGSKSSTKTAQERLEEARNKIAQRNQAAKNRQNTSSNTKQNSVWDDGNNGNSTGNPGAWWESSYQRKDTTSQQGSKNYLKDAASLYDKLKTAGAGVASNLSSIGQKAGTGLKAAAQAAAAAGKTTPAASTTKTNIKTHASDVATRKNPNLIEETLKLGKDLNGRTDTTIANGAANNTVQGLISDDYIPESARDAQAAYMEAKREYEDYIANKGKNNSYPQKPLTEDEQRALQTAETNGLQLGGLKQFDDEWAIQTEATDAAKEKELKAKMDAAAEALETAKKEGAAAAKAKSRDKAIKQYNQLMYTSDFGKNLQNPITKDDQIIIGYQGDSFKSNDAQLIYNMTDRERLIMTYLRNAHGEDAANDYLNILKPDIERRIHADVAERAADAAEKAPITASAVSVIVNLADTLAGTAYTGLQTGKKILGLKDSEIDPYSTAFLGGTWRDAARSTVGANANEWAQEKADNLSNLLGMEEGTINVGNVPNFIYNALMSAADSATSGAIGAATGTTIVGAALQSAGSFVNTVRQCKLQGTTDERALGLGVVAGTLEYATEKMGFDRLADIITHPNKSAIRSILSNMMSEYGEEASTDVLNFTAEYIADCLDGTDMSTFNQMYNAYIEQGLDENKALQNTFLDLLGQANESGLAGAISGGVMGGGSVILGKTANAIMQHEFFTGMNAAAEEGDAQAKAYLYNNREGTVDKETYDTAFRVIWDGATNGLTMEQIEESAPDITDALSEAQKQGIYGAAVNATTEEEHTVTQPERSRPTEATADQGEMEAAPAAGEAATTTQPIGTKPTTTFVTDEDVTPEQTADERTTTAQPTVKTTPTAVTADQGDVEQTVNQQAGTTTQPQKTRPKMTRIQIDDEGNRTTSDAEGTSQETGDAQTQQSGAKVSDNISEESAADIKAYITDQTKTNKGGVKASYAQQNLTGEQTRQIRILDELGRHYGVEIEIVDTIANGRANGYYGGGNKIVVALDATDQAYVHVGTHELTHYLKKTNERGYRVLEKTVLDELRKTEPGLAGVYNVDEEVQKRIAAYAEQGIELDEDAALEEIVAEALPAIWSDEKAVRAFVNQNRSLAQKIRDFIVDFVERLKDYTLNYAYDEDYTDSQALRVREQDAAGTLENIARIFDLALESAKGMQQTTAQTTYQTTTNAAGTQLNAASGRTSTQKTASQATTKQAPTAVTADQTNANRTETSRTEANRTNTETRTETAQADEEDTTWESKELKHARVNAMQQEDAVAKAQEKVESLQIRQGINKDQYTELKSILKTDGVAITPLQKKEIIHNYGKYGDYTKMLFGKIKLYESARGWDDRWRDMQNAYPGIFRGDYPEDGIGEALLEVADYLYPNRALEEAQAKLQEEEVRLEEMQDEIKQLEKRDRSATAEERVARDVEFDREEAEDLPFALKRQGKKGQHIELADGVQYSLKSFREQIQDVLDGKFPVDDHVYVMETPEVLQKVGLKSLPMLMTQKHAYTTTLSEGKYKGANYHGLGLGIMEQVPDAIANPVMVIKSHGHEGRVTVITELTDKNGQSVIAPVIVDGHGVWQNVHIDANVIATVYGRKNAAGDIRRAFADNEVLYASKEKSGLIAQILGIQFPDKMNENRSSSSIIADFARAVKNQNTQESAENARKSTESERKYALKKNGDAGQDLSLNDREYAMFREKIGEIKIGKKAQFPKSASGEYILAIDNKLVYTDGRFVKPSVSRVVELYVGDETETDLARQYIFQGEKEGKDIDAIQRTVERCFGEGSILVDLRENWRGNGRQNGRGKRGNLQEVREDHNGDLSSEEKGRRFALKTESENKVDVERTWRAGNHSLSEQTQSAIQSEMSTEQTQHERVRLVGDLAKWVKKRAGQIVREYKSDANVADVSKDMTSLISELSENGASSAAMNATINMAKGIIEKSRRGENKLREKYKDLCKAMRETKITLSPVQRLEAENLTGSYGRYRQSLFGSVNLTNSGEGTALDIMWQTWSESYPELFTPGLGRKEQVQRLAEIKTMLEPYYQNVYGENLDAAATDLGMRIYAEALEQIGEKGQAQATTTMLEDMRKRYKHLTDDAMNKLKQEQLERFQQIANDLHAAREAGDRALQDEIMKVYRATVKQAGFKEAEAEARSAYRAQFEDAAAWRKAHERTIKYARNLRQELAKPTKQKHVPAGLEAPVLEVLNCIDMSTTGRETQGTRQWKKSLENITQWLDEQARLQQNALDENQSTTDGHEGVWMAICGRTMQDLRTSIGIVKATSGKITEMSLPEMNALSNAMAIINHSINSINETWTLSRNESIRELGDKCVNELKEKRTNRAQESKIPLVRELDNLLNVDQLDAVSFFERLGSVGETVAESLTQGQSKAYERIREAADRAEEIFAIEGARDERDRQKTIRGWRTEEHTFKLTRGTEVEDVTMSGTQLMELYALSKREQALKHILTGGIRIATLDNKKGSVYNYQLTQDQLNAMLSELTADQKACVDRMQGYLSGDVAEWGNEVTMKMYLYKAFGEKNYWPIHSDNDYLRTKEQDGSLMYNALLNASWTKATVDKPKNPITIGDAIETFSGHVSDMATYSGLAMPVDDLLKWYNYQSRDENGNADFNGSIKKEIRRTIGSAGTQYIQRLMDDLNGMGRQAYENGLVGGMIGNYKRAAIMAKIRVVIQQPTAILRAGAMIDPKYIAMARPGKGVISEMQEHSGLAWWKSNGNYEIGTGASMKSIITGMQDSTYEDVTEKLGAPAGMADDIGWATIWQAVKRETEAQNPDTEVGSDEYWKKVRERFEDVCIRTQVVDTVLTRSQLMRSKSQLMKSLTAFMSEPTKNFNLVRNGLSAVYNAKTPEARKAAIKTLVRSTAAITAAQMLNAVVTAGHDMLKYYDPDDEDDDSRLEMFVDNWLSDMADGLNPLGNIPIIKDVYALVTGDDVERMDLSAISAAVSAVEKAGNYISGNSKGLTFYGAFKPLATALGNLVGAPASGLIADAELIVNIISPGALRTTQRDSSTGDAYTMIYEAIASGDTKKADKLRTKLKSGAYGNTPKSDKEIDAGVRDILAAEDDRIRQCYELKQQGSSTKQLVALEKEIMADGFTQEQVVGAVNRYPAIVGKTIKDSYKAAYALGETEKMEQYAKQAKSLGYGDADIEGWVATKDLDEQLTGGEMYSSEDMMTYIRNGTEGDIEDVVNYRISVNGGANAEQSVHNSIAGEFKGEYTDLVTSGQTGKAADLKERLLTAGLTEKTIDGWVYTNDVLASWLIDGEGTMQDAQDVLEYKVKYSTAQNPEESGTNALKSYRDEYIELVETDKKKAKAMRERLIELGLSESLIEKWDAAAKEE